MPIVLWLCLSLLGATGVAGSLEVLSGTVILPRVWWLYSDPNPLCFFCDDLNRFEITPASYGVWEKQVVANFNDCIKQQTKAACNKVVTAEYNRIGSGLKSGNLFVKTRTRFRMIVDAKNAKALWALIIASIMLALSVCFTFLCLLLLFVVFMLWLPDRKAKRTSPARV